ncbi:hypothetical protein CAPTEDRAFT_198977 [Capitella teleta]|uniref:Uncharacterized protein n=1 Tax=Capitella teleta TaxID=283909 RepID=R7TLA5_CAPTE|nr:hypothetical protein CAPTEDRAFT_198977 [Capitella teleta]|eukprot:ELT92306.1 hypothetical protein CAPTEDRAFT_198977 [Capitella teleta]
MCERRLDILLSMECAYTVGYMYIFNNDDADLRGVINYSMQLHVLQYLYSMFYNSLKQAYPASYTGLDKNRGNSFAVRDPRAMWIWKQATCHVSNIKPVGHYIETNDISDPKSRFHGVKDPLVHCSRSKFCVVTLSVERLFSQNTTGKSIQIATLDHP